MDPMDVYEELSQIKSDLEIDVELIDTMILNGSYDRVNRYLKEAVVEMRHALSDLSDAEFHLYTGG